MRLLVNLVRHAVYNGHGVACVTVFMIVEVDVVRARYSPDMVTRALAALTTQEGYNLAS